MASCTFTACTFTLAQCTYLFDLAPLCSVIGAPFNGQCTPFILLTNGAHQLLQLTQQKHNSRETIETQQYRINRDTTVETTIDTTVETQQ